MADSHLHGRTVVSFGIPTGTIGRAACFNSITVRDGIDCELTEVDFGGPVSVKIWTPDNREMWFGIADVSTVERVNSERRQTAMR
ncbi:hypothetical protein [Stieleria varia]|uniref:hypothetical protein n=1 Tax=Stieleria varia TaxID=2528005 RepID=UPI0011B7346F|nr:hypothetical protein [Stieleria varia]